MSGTWRDEARRIITEIGKTIPADANLKTRKRALNAGRPFEYANTSWGRKMWGNSATEYLVKHGMEPRKPPPAKAPHLSPLERMKAKAEAARQSP